MDALPYRLDPSIREVCARAVVLSGSARSGTTITGKLLHSMKGVEYIFEPPTLFSLFALAETLSDETWGLLYETYLYEEFLVDALSGRALNCNRADASSIYKVKVAEEINARLEHSLPRERAEELAHRAVPAYKVPDVVPLLDSLIQRYPETRLVLMRRDPVGTFHSLKNKGWFTDHALSHTNQTWPFAMLGGLKVSLLGGPRRQASLRCHGRAPPHRLLLPANDREPSTSLSRACRGLRRTGAIPLGRGRNHGPILGLSFGPKTGKIAGQVARRGGPRDPSILEGLEPAVRQRVKACVANPAVL